MIRVIAFMFFSVAFIAFVSVFVFGYVAIFTHNDTLTNAAILSFCLSAVSGFAGGLARDAS